MAYARTGATTDAMPFVVKPWCGVASAEDAVHRLWLDSALRAAFLSALISLVYPSSRGARRVRVDKGMRARVTRASFGVERCERVFEWRRARADDRPETLFAMEALFYLRETHTVFILCVL